MTTRRAFITGLVSFVAAAGFVGCLLSGIVVAMGFRPDIRGEFIERTVGGIEIGYLCQKRGFTEAECKTDFTGYMAKAKAAR